MRANQADLLGRRRRPRSGRILQRETAHGDKVDPRLLRIEDRLPHIDFHALAIGIDAFELRPDRGVFLVTSPNQSGLLAAGSITSSSLAASVSQSPLR